MMVLQDLPGFPEFLQLLQLLMRKQTVVTVFVSGLPGSGKTTFALELCSLFPDQSAFFSQDWFLDFSSPKRRSRILEAIASGNRANIEHESNPRNWYDINALFVSLETLKSKRHVELKQLWNQKTGEKDVQISISLPEKSALIVCEDSYLFDENAVPQADIIVYLDVALAVSHQRQVDRDRHRTDAEYFDLKRKITEQYDMPYITANRQNIHFVFPT